VLSGVVECGGFRRQAAPSRTAKCDTMPRRQFNPTVLEQPMDAVDQNIRFCNSADGVRLAYAVSGEGPPLAMSATWLTHLEHQWRSLAWRPWLDAFQRDHTLLRYDSRGCGLSDRDTPDLSFENWVRDFARVVEAASFPRFALLATCWGGPVAIEYAARYPERVSHLILYGTYARGRLRWPDRPKEVEKARVLLELMKSARARRARRDCCGSGQLRDRRIAWALGKNGSKSYYTGVRQDLRRAPLPGDRAGPATQASG
jgi:pimeloyl-ACP methyl ester carboxylesterase